MTKRVIFRGALYPIAALVGRGFPALYFQRISAGVFNKGLDMADLWPNHLALAAFCGIFWAPAAALMRKQEV